MSASIETPLPPGYEILPKTSPEGELLGDVLEVALGPQHPSTHGVFRMDVVLDGETVLKLKPVFGYLHRNHEKIAENTSYLGSMPYTDRLDYFCSLTNNWAYALAVEKLAGLAVPERAEFIRVITAELTRLLNHTCLVGFLLMDMGALGTPLMYAFREREKILDLFESLTGARMMCNYMRFGGCRVDLPAGWLDEVNKVVDAYPRFLDEFENLLTANEILIARTQGVGKLSRELAISGQGHSRRPDHRSESQTARFPSESRRSLRPHRGAEGRTGLLPHQRRLAQSVSLPRPPAEPDQPDDFGGHVPGPNDRRRGRDPGQRGHRVRRGGPLNRSPAGPRPAGRGDRNSVGRGSRRAVTFVHAQGRFGSANTRYAEIGSHTEEVTARREPRPTGPADGPSRMFAPAFCLDHRAEYPHSPAMISDC